MYSTTIDEEHSGKTLQEIITDLKNKDDFKSKMGSAFMETTCLVTLDGEIFAYSSFGSTIAHTGQLMKVIPLVSGG